MENKFNELMALVEDMDKTPDLVEPICDLISGVEFPTTLMALIGTVIDVWSAKHHISPEESVAMFSNFANMREQMLAEGVYDNDYINLGGDDNE